MVTGRRPASTRQGFFRNLKIYGNRKVFLFVEEKEGMSDAPVIYAETSDHSIGNRLFATYDRCHRQEILQIGQSFFRIGLVIACGSSCIIMAVIAITFLAIFIGMMSGSQIFTIILLSGILLCVFSVPVLFGVLAMITGMCVILYGLKKKPEDAPIPPASRIPTSGTQDDNTYVKADE